MSGYAEFYAQYDEAVRNGADIATNAGLAYVRELLPPAAVFFVLALAALAVANQLSMAAFIRYMGRMVLVMWLVAGAAFTPYVRDLLVDDIPSAVASRINGRVDNRMDAVAQFQLIDDASANYVAQVNQVATGFSQIGNKIAAWAARGMQKIFLFFVFVVWIAMRQLAYLTVAVLAFMLIFYPFESTKSWINAQLSKVLGVMFWQVSASVLLKIMLGGVQIYLKRVSTTGLTLSIDQQVDQCLDIAMFFMGMLLLFIMVPASVGIGASAAASSSIASAAMVSAAGNMARAGNSIQKAGYNLNKAAKNMARSVRGK